MRSSASAFDAGNHGEAKRLAVAIRVLVHDTAASTSLLTQLGVKDTMDFRDTADQLPLPPIVPEEETTSFVIGSGLTMIRMPSDPSQPTWCSPTGQSGRDGAPVPFDHWWCTDVVSTGWKTEDRYTRRALVLAVANQDGGAHVQPKLGPSYEALSQGGALFRIERPGPPPTVEFVNPVPPAMRQIAAELIVSIEDVFGEAG